MRRSAPASCRAQTASPGAATRRSATPRRTASAASAAAGTTRAVRARACLGPGPWPSRGCAAYCTPARLCRVALCAMTPWVWALTCRRLRRQRQPERCRRRAARSALCQADLPSNSSRPDDTVPAGQRAAHQLAPGSIGVASSALAAAATPSVCQGVRRCKRAWRGRRGPSLAPAEKQATAQQLGWEHGRARSATRRLFALLNRCRLADKTGRARRGRPPEAPLPAVLRGVQPGVGLCRVPGCARPPSGAQS